MKVLDLQCGHGHNFEGWFGSEDDFQSQLLRKLLECPMCGNSVIVKKLSAPRLNLGAKPPADAKQSSAPDAMTSASAGDSRNATPSKELSVVEAASPASPSQQQTDMAAQAQELMQRPEFQETWMEIAKHVVAKTEDVGTQFASEARKMHYGETKERGIRGHATRDETLEMLDEGINVMPLLLPEALKGSVH